MVSELDIPFETGIEYRLNEEGHFSEFPALNNVFDGVQFSPVADHNPLIRIHKHHNQLHPIFSYADVTGMIKFFIDKNSIDIINSNNISSLMISEMGIFAMRVQNREKVQILHDYLISNNNYGNKYMKNAYLIDVLNQTERQCDGACSAQEYKTFLQNNFVKFFNRLDTGLTLYFAPHPANGEGNYTWIKQSLN